MNENLAAKDKLPVISDVWLDQLVSLGRAAGAAIMAIYRSRDAYELSHKTDNSPLTAADLAAHKLIVAQLPSLLDVPIVSEEGDLAPFSVRQLWQAYWLVDPLDGTKEFVAGNGEFTVNIALIVEGKPVVGLVHIPVTGMSYLGVQYPGDQASILVQGAWKYEVGHLPQPIKVSSLQDRYRQGLPLRIVMSQRHGAAEARQLIEHLHGVWPGDLIETQAGSSLKFCRIAEGVADFYPRLAPTCEWDTAAAQAILEAAGGALIYIPDADKALKSFIYNAQESLLNPSFYALGDRRFDWIALLDAKSL